jgi:hypothetical protein
MSKYVRPVPKPLNTVRRQIQLGSSLIIGNWKIKQDYSITDAILCGAI